MILIDRSKIFTSILCLLMAIISFRAVAQTPLERLVADEGSADVHLHMESARLAEGAFDDIVSRHIRFEPDLEAASALRIDRPERLRLTIPTPDGEHTLELVQVEVTAPEYRVESASGKARINGPLGLHYHGIVAGRDGSMAAVSFFDGWFTLLASTREEGNFTVNRLLGEQAYVSYFDRDLRIVPDAVCHAADQDKLHGYHQIPQDIDVSQVAGDDLCFRMHYELDRDLYINKGSVEQTAAYMEGLHSQIAVVYANESINYLVSYMHVWDINDPFNPRGSSSTALGHLRDYKTVALDGQINGDLLHLVANDGQGLGGIAYVGVLCNENNYNIAYSEINTNYSNFPVYSWSVNVVAHEVGHNLGSRHTHSCSWGPNNDMRIDDCGPTAGFYEGDCESILGQPDPGGGTVMSYCHLNAGISLTNGFGQYPGDLIRQRIANAACLSACPAGTANECLPPYQLSVSDIGEHEAIVEWYHDPSVSLFEVRYGYDGTWLTELVSAGDSSWSESLLLQGLDAATKYEVYIRSLCDSSDSEENKLRFSTLCNEIFDLYFIELFDGAAWEERSYRPAPCWTSEVNNNYGWSTERYMTATNNTGPVEDHTTGFGKYAYTEATPGNVSAVAYLTSPQIDMTGSVGPLLSYWYHMTGDDTRRLTVAVSNNNGANWLEIQVLEGEQQLTMTDEWRQSVISLSQFQDDTIRIRFEGTNGGNLADIAIDDVIIADSQLVDISVASFATFGCGLSSTEPVTARVSNTGFQLLPEGTEIDLYLELEGVPVSTESFTLTSDMPPGEQAEYTFDATVDLEEFGEYAVLAAASMPGDALEGNNSRTVMVSSRYAVEGYPYTESFEDGGDWVAGGVHSSWQLGTPAKNIIKGASDGFNAWVTGGLGEDLYNADEESYIEGPCFNFANLADPSIEMDVWWEIEPYWEGAQFQYSLDEGLTWYTLGDTSAAWYNADEVLTLEAYGGVGWSGAELEPDPDRPWLDGSRGWVQVQQGMKSLGGEPSVYFRMLFRTDTYVEHDGIAIDNIRISGTPITPPCHEVSVNNETCMPAEAGQQVVVLQDAGGCDSIITVTTTLLPRYDFINDLYSCDPADTGTVADSFTAVSGCDSIISTVTHLLPSYNMEVSAFTCDTSEVGVSSDSMMSSQGCDSIVITNTVLSEPYVSAVQQTSCNPSDTGLTADTLQASDGCDSIVNTTTVLLPVEAGFTLVENGGVVNFTNTSENATSYQWSFGDGNTNTVENPTNTYSTSGDYEVMLIASNGDCPSDTFTFVITIVISGVDQVGFADKVSVFPNPSGGRFVLELVGSPHDDHVHLTLYDPAGRELGHRQVSYNGHVREVYDMEDPVPGMYLLRIGSGVEFFTMKFLVVQ